MHVGVLIFADNENMARGLLLSEEFCYRGLTEEELDAGEVDNGIWDYPYDLSKYWWDGKNEETKVHQGIYVSDLKEKIRLGHLTDMVLEMFYFFMDDAESGEEFNPNPPTAKQILQSNGAKKVFVGSVHV